MHRALLLIAGLGLGCVEVAGGAVEASWKVFGPSGRECPDTPENRCFAGRVGRVIIRATPVDTAGVAPFEREFPCTETTGSTRFALPEGRYSIQLATLPAGECTPGPCRATTPAPVVKDVLHGKVSSMGLVQIVAENSPDCS